MAETRAREPAPPGLFYLLIVLFNACCLTAWYGADSDNFLERLAKWQRHATFSLLPVYLLADGCRRTIYRPAWTILVWVPLLFFFSKLAPWDFQGPKDKYDPMDYLGTGWIDVILHPLPMGVLLVLYYRKVACKPVAERYLFAVLILGFVIVYSSFFLYSRLM